MQIKNPVVWLSGNTENNINLPKNELINNRELVEIAYRYFLSHEGG